MGSRKPKIGSGIASCSECPQRESDSWPSAPEADALSTELQGRGTFRSLNDVRLCRAVFGMVLIDVAPETIAARRASSPPVLNDRWRESGDWIGFSPATSRTNGKVQIPLWTCRMFGRKPPCRAMLALASRFRYACSATPMKRLIDRMNRFVPPSGIEPASTVLQTVALPAKLQRRARQAIFGSSGHKPFPACRTGVFPPCFAPGRGEPAAAYSLIDRCAYAWRFTRHRAPTELRYPDPVLKRHLLFL